MARFDFHKLFNVDDFQLLGRVLGRSTPAGDDVSYFCLEVIIIISYGYFYTQMLLAKSR